MPCLRESSATAVPASQSLRIETICASVKRVFFTMDSFTVAGGESTITFNLISGAQTRADTWFAELCNVVRDHVNVNGTYFHAAGERFGVRNLFGHASRLACRVLHERSLTVRCSHKISAVLNIRN